MSEAELALHMRLHFNEKTYKCKFCNREFALYGSMKSHEARHRKEEKKFACVLCGCEFALWSRLKEHLEALHGVLRFETTTDSSASLSQLQEAQG